MWLVAPNGFKGTLSSVRTAQAMTLGVRRAHPAADLLSFPMSDGGRGFLDALKALHPGLRRRQVKVRPPVGPPRAGVFGETPDGVAYAEMAMASGVHLVPEAARRPAHLSSYGTGELLRAVMTRPHIHKIVIGLGDTATLDGGAGILEAFGVRLLNRQGEPVASGNLGLGQAARLDWSALHPALEAFQARGGRVICACDVRNPLLGPDGAAYTFGLQKGATPDELPQLEANLRHWADLLEATFGRPARDLPGAGAAGGAGFALAAWLGAELVSGAQLLTGLPLFQAALAQATVILTGEGQLDRQSLAGKTTSHLAALGRARNVPVLAFAGRILLAETDWRTAGFAAVYELPPHSPQQVRRVLAACVADALAHNGFGAI
ncbi:MAG: glycerate kinase [Chloracidobacterium sp.]|nr:glycerate kinase [Chloracidobacterium sp.]MDW8216460.1 glycerate kinase [Acidobacteriota bacterium]